jgi:hypothetical protein
MSYKTLERIIQENKENQEATDKEQENPTSLCPVCQWRFDINSEGRRSCPMCNWRDR